MTPQASIAHYRITAKLGEGGMGQVWRAIDTKLQREVAIKVLPDAFAHDPERMARFQREAQVLASLNHPNIAAVYGVEERAIVLELVDGPTLADRIAQGPMPVDEALDIARQIGAALETAHDSGIVHRDLKPANIKLTAGGRVKVLDFGLAKAMSGEPLSVDPSSSPTLTIRATTAGMIIGTAAYMAPEQAKGKAVDKRADIWAFGVVLFEMLTGRQLFEGETVSDILAAVLTKEPDWERAPAEVRRLLQSCLERDPGRRLRDVGDAWRLIDVVPDGRAATNAPARKPYVWIAAAAVLGVAAIALATVHFREQPGAAPLVKFQLPAPENTHFGVWISASPDGRHVAYIAAGADGVQRIWDRALDSLQSRPIASGDASSTVTHFWSPDSQYVVYESGLKIRKAPVAGGPPQTLCDAPPVMLGGSWSAATNTILFGTNIGPIMRVSPDGGTAVPVTRLDRAHGELRHSDPTFLPDGKHFLYLRYSTDAAVRGVYVRSIDQKPEQPDGKRVEPTDFSFGYAPAPPGDRIGHLLLLREGTLVARPFDERRLEPVGEAVPVVESVGTSLTRAVFSVSPSGVLAYRETGGTKMQLGWYDRQGQSVGHVVEGEDYADLALSPDAARVAYSRIMSVSVRQLWIVDVARGVQSRFTFLPESIRAPLWSPDGRAVAFSGNVSNTIYLKDASDATDPEPILKAASNSIATDWSRDGRFLLYTVIGNGYDIWALANPRGPGDRKAFPVANTEFNEMHGSLSPDSKWIAYDSNESGTAEVYVRPFPPGEGRNGKWLVSANGGQQPRWSPDGKQLFFFAGVNGSLMSVDVKTEPRFQTSSPSPLFVVPGVLVNDPMFKYAITPDGKRFLIVSNSPNAVSKPATVILNWRAALKH